MGYTLLQLCILLASLESYNAHSKGYWPEEKNIIHLKATRNDYNKRQHGDRRSESIPTVRAQDDLSHDDRATVTSPTGFSVISIVASNFKAFHQDTSSQMDVKSEDFKNAEKGRTTPFIQMQDEKQSISGYFVWTKLHRLMIQLLHWRYFNCEEIKEKHSFSPRYRRSLPLGFLVKATTALHGAVKKESRNNIVYCPQHCSCMQSTDYTITLVDCSNRDLKEIPSLPSTSKTVYLQNNKIHTISCNSFASLPTLIQLDLSYNEIHELANCSFASLVSLQYLNLSNCGLDTLPQGIFTSLRSLLKLDLSINNIKNIDGQLFLYLHQLTSLTFYRNSLTKVGNGSFQGLRSLRFLSLQRNLLEYVPNTFEPRAFEGLSSLEILHVQGNQKELSENFTYPDQALSLLPSLQQLRLDGHPRSLGSGFASLTNLSLLDFSTDHEYDVESFCEMGDAIPPDFFANLATRQSLYLNLSSCFINKIPTELFKFLPSIHTLDLSGNHYLGFDGFEIGSEGLRNSTLTTLNISHIVKSQRLSFIKNTTFRHLSHTELKVLIVDTCQLSTIDTGAVSRLPKTIELISFQDNRIQFGGFLIELILLNKLQTVLLAIQLHYRKKEVTTTGIAPPLPNGMFTSNNSKKGIPYNNTVQNSTAHDLASGNYTGITDLFTSSLPFNKDNIVKEMNLNHSLWPYSRDITHTEKTNGGSAFCGSAPKASKGSYFDSPITFLPKRLEYIYASDMNIKLHIPRIHVVNNKVLKYFDFSKNGVKCFGGPITGVPSLQYLDLSQNWCLRMNPFMFSDMPSLTTLLLNHNVLGQALSDDENGVTFSALDNLKTLDLSNNAIKTLSQHAFRENRNLCILNLSNNDLSHFHPDLSSITRLEILDLSVNTLEHLSEVTCRQLVDMKKRNAKFTIRIKSNRFLCDCGNFRLLKLLLERPDIFYDADYFECKLANGSSLHYNQLAQYLPELAMTCIAQTTFTLVSIVFFTMIAMMMIASVYQYKRWQWKYLYYLGKSRLHIGSMYVTYRHVAHTFVTYDQVRVCLSQW